MFQKVRDISDDARVVLVTGLRHEMDDRIQRSLSAGADAVCYKPFQLPELLETLQRLSAEVRADKSARVVAARFSKWDLMTLASRPKAQPDRARHSNPVRNA